MNDLCDACGGTGEIKVHCLYDLGGGDHDDTGCPDPGACFWADDHPCECSFPMVEVDQ